MYARLQDCPAILSAEVVESAGKCPTRTANSSLPMHQPGPDGGDETLSLAP